MSIVAKGLDGSGSRPGPSSTSIGGRTRPRRQCVRWGSRLPCQEVQQSPLFVSSLLWPNGRPFRQLL